jgi:hypothetical protein
MTTCLAALINQAKDSVINIFTNFGTFDLYKCNTIDSTVCKEKRIVICISILSNPDIVLQQILVVGDNLQLLTRPIPATASDGMSITMGSLSYIIGHSIPVSVRQTHFTQCFTSLVARGDVDPYRLPTAGPGVPDPADPTTMNHMQASMGHLNFGATDEPLLCPVITVLPITLPLPRGIKFTTGNKLSNKFPGMAFVFPLFNIWRKAIQYINLTNEGKLVTKSGPLFDPVGINQEQFNNFCIRDSFQTSMQMLSWISALHRCLHSFRRCQRSRLDQDRRRINGQTGSRPNSRRQYVYSSTHHSLGQRNPSRCQSPHKHRSQTDFLCNCH